MQTLTKEEYLEIESQELESTQSEEWIPGKKDIKKCVYDPYGEEDDERVEDNESISLEELEKEEEKTKRPSHQRPVDKLFLVAIVLIPVFGFIYMFMGGTKKPAQIAKAIQQSNTEDQKLLAEKQQLQNQIDKMELELAQLKQEQNSPTPVEPAPTPEVKQAEKVQTPPPPKPPQQIPPAKTVVARNTPRQAPRQAPPPPRKPTAEDLMRRRQLLAQSIVFGGGMSHTGTAESFTPVYQPEYEPEIASNPIPSDPNVTLVSSRNQQNRALLMANVDTPAVQEPIDFSIGRSSDSRTPSIQKQFTKQFSPGTSISGESLHPVFFSGGQSATVNMRVTDSNTPVPEGTNLSVQLQEINGAVTVTSIQAQVNNQILDLEASNWQVTAKNGMPLIATSVEEPGSNNGQAWSNAAGTVLRNTSRVYRSDDFFTSTLIGVGSSLAEGQLNRSNRRAYNYNSRTNIRVIEQNTPIKLYVIQGFGM